MYFMASTLFHTHLLYSNGSGQMWSCCQKYKSSSGPQTPQKHLWKCHKITARDRKPSRINTRHPHAVPRHGRPHILTRRTESWSPEPESRVKAASSPPWGHCSRAQHGRGTPSTPGAAQHPRPHGAPTCRRSSTARRSMGHAVGQREQHVPVALPAQPRRDRSWWAHSGPQAPLVSSGSVLEHNPQPGFPAGADCTLLMGSPTSVRFGAPRRCFLPQTAPCWYRKSLLFRNVLRAAVLGRTERVSPKSSLKFGDEKAAQ